MHGTRLHVSGASGLPSVNRQSSRTEGCKIPLWFRVFWRHFVTLQLLAASFAIHDDNFQRATTKPYDVT